MTPSTPKPLGPRDLQALAAAWACMKNPPAIDYEALAAKTGAKDGKAAYKLLWEVKKKLATHDTSSPTSAKGAAGGAKRGPAVIYVEDEDEEEETLAKKRKKTTSAAGLGAGPKKRQHYDEDETDVKAKPGSGDHDEAAI